MELLRTLTLILLTMTDELTELLFGNLHTADDSKNFSYAQASN